MFTFAPFRLKIRLDGVTEDSGSAGVNKGRLLYRESLQKGTPPPIWGAKSAFTPIIFRTKNPEKSRLGQIRKNFGKNLRENVSGKGKPPIFVERGQGVLKYERIEFVGKDSGIIRDCKRIVLSFCFRTIEPCLCLVVRCLYDLLSFGT